MLALALALLLTLAKTDAADAAIGVCNVPSATYPTIQSAIVDAACNNTDPTFANTNEIHVAPGTYNEHLSIIDRSVTIIGAGPSQTIIDGQSTGRVVYIEGITGVPNFGGEIPVAFMGVTIQHGQTTSPVVPDEIQGNGAGIFVNGSDGGEPDLHLGCRGDDPPPGFVATKPEDSTQPPTLIRCDPALNPQLPATPGVVIQDNVSAVNGGGIATWESGNIYTDVTITRNRAAYAGGGIFSEGNISATHLVVSYNESFGSEAPSCSGNPANPDQDPCDTPQPENIDGDGGGVENQGKFEAVDSTFDNNVAHNDGGGGLHNGGTGFELLNSVVSNNRALDGAGIDNSKKLEIQNVTISGNVACGGPVATNGTCTSGKNVEGGGGINQEGRAELAFVTIAGNSAPPGTGGGIAAPADEPEPRNQFTDLKNSIIADNTSGDCSGNVHPNDVAPPNGTGDLRELYDEGPFSITTRGYNLSGDSSCGFDTWFGSTTATIYKVTTPTETVCDAAVARNPASSRGTVTLTPNADGTVHVQGSLTGLTPATTYKPALYNGCPTPVFTPPASANMTTDGTGAGTFAFDVAKGVLPNRQALGLRLDASATDILTTDLLDGLPPLPPPKPTNTDLINTDPKLAPLADNGGLTMTRGLYPDSPALDRVGLGFCETSAQEADPGENPPPPNEVVNEDQRHFPRPVGKACDIGAFEGTVPRPLAPDADMGILKSAPATGTQGQDLTYTLDVTNHGPAVASATVGDDLPPGVTFVRASPAVGTCTQSGSTVTCQLPDIQVGDTVRIVIVVRPRAAGTLTNTATVTGSVPDGNMANNSSSATTRVGAARVAAAATGKAKLSSRTGCVTSAFTAVVRGRSIASVRFTLDGKNLAHVRRLPRSTFSVRIAIKGLRVGFHRVKAVATFVKASGTPRKTLHSTFRICGSQLAAPHFTG